MGFFCNLTNFHMHRHPLTLHMEIQYLLPESLPRPLTHSPGFHITVAAWLKQRSPRQVNNQPTQSAVCDRFHANKAFSNSLLRGSTRRGLSDCSLLITINLQLFLRSNLEGGTEGGQGGEDGVGDSGEGYRGEGAALHELHIKSHFCLPSLAVLYL